MAHYNLVAQVATVATHRLRSFAQDPLLGCPSRPQRSVLWELEKGIEGHLRVFAALVEHQPTADAAKSIDKTVASGFKAVEAIIAAIDWDGSARDSALESATYARILECVERIFGAPLDVHIILRESRTSLVEALTRVFVRVIECSRTRLSLDALSHSLSKAACSQSLFSITRTNTRVRASTRDVRVSLKMMGTSSGAPNVRSTHSRMRA